MAKKRALAKASPQSLRAVAAATGDSPAAERNPEQAPDRGGEPSLADGRLELDEWRRRIDRIDEQLMGLLNSRSACAVEIGRIKRALGLPVYSPEREAAILERVMRDNPGPLDPLAIRRVFERVIDESRRLERMAAATRAREGVD